MQNPILPLMRRLGVLAAVVFVGACTAPSAEIARHVADPPRRYVVVLPEDRDTSEALGRLLAQHRAEGLDVSVVRFPLGAPPAERLAAVRRGLPETGGASAYVLLLATPDELPLGPWTVEGLDAPIESDLPLFLGAEPALDGRPGTVLDEEDWGRVGAPDFPWIVGRISAADDAALARVLEAGRTYEERAGHVALLGSERFAVWWDSSSIMARARGRFPDAWTVVTYGEDAPSDIRLGEFDPGGGPLHVPLLADFPLDALAVDASPESLVFTAHWAHVAPSVVYLNSHGSSVFGVHVGDYLLSELRLDRWRALAEARGLRATPVTPAVLVVAACRAGPPDSELMPRLFDEGWIAALVASTELTEPTPLLPAIRAEIDIGSLLASGLPIGVAVQIFRESYLADADDSPTYLLSGGVRAAVAKNLLGMTLYGDPALRLPAAPPAAR